MKLGEKATLDITGYVTSLCTDSHDKANIHNSDYAYGARYVILSSSDGE